MKYSRATLSLQKRLCSDRESSRCQINLKLLDKCFRFPSLTCVRSSLKTRPCKSGRISREVVVHSFLFQLYFLLYSVYCKIILPVIVDQMLSVTSPCVRLKNSGMRFHLSNSIQMIVIVFGNS